MLKRLAAAALFIALSMASAIAWPSPAGAVSYTVGVCDTSYPTRCLKPAADGSITVNSYGGTTNLVSGLTVAMTGTTSTAVTGIGAPATGLRNYITTIVCGNSHATVGTFVEIQDGNGGTTFFTIPAAAVYGGSVINFPAPLKQPTTATALYVKDTMTGANVICSAAGFKAP